MTTLGNNLKKIRKMRGYTQLQVANMIHVTQAAISSWEIGRTEPTMRDLDALCEIYKCTRSELIEGESASNAFTLSPDERIIIEQYRSASEAEKVSIRRAITLAVLLSSHEEG